MKINIIYAALSLMAVAGIATVTSYIVYTTQSAALYGRLSITLPLYTVSAALSRSSSSCALAAG